MLRGGNIQQQSENADMQILAGWDESEWFAAEECVRMAPGSVNVLETVRKLFPASRSLAVPLSARGPPLHFSNAQITQF